MFEKKFEHEIRQSRYLFLSLPLVAAVLLASSASSWLVILEG
jgi:hypothetical protein